jgi:hypothetical protein
MINCVSDLNRNYINHLAVVVYYVVKQQKCPNHLLFTGTFDLVELPCMVVDD